MMMIIIIAFRVLEYITHSNELNAKTMNHER